MEEECREWGKWREEQRLWCAASTIARFDDSRPCLAHRTSASIYFLSYSKQPFSLSIPIYSFCSSLSLFLFCFPSLPFSFLFCFEIVSFLGAFHLLLNSAIRRLRHLPLFKKKTPLHPLKKTCLVYIEAPLLCCARVSVITVTEI